MAFRITRVPAWWLLIAALCVFVFLFSLRAKLELYGPGLEGHVYPCSSSKLCLDAHTPKLTFHRHLLARLAVSLIRRPTLGSEPLVDEAYFSPIPREMSLPYQRRLYRSPPIS